MVKWSVVAGLGLIVALGGCSSRTGQVAYTQPGWYLERPRFMMVTGPEFFGGPFTYDQCEAKRMEFDEPTARRLICIMEKTRPGPYGPFDKVQKETTPSRSS